MGFRVELKYPSHRKKLKTWSLMQSLQIGLTRAITKKGSQHTMKAPVTMARVLAAFFSRFSSRETCFLTFSFLFFLFSLWVESRALWSVWLPVLESLTGPFLVDTNVKLITLIYWSSLPVFRAGVTSWNFTNFIFSGGWWIRWTLLQTNKV